MQKLLPILLATLVVAAAFAPAVAAGNAGVAVEATGTDATCEYPLELTDVTGENVTVDEPPERVVALQPSDAQLVYEIGAEDSLVGMPINQYTDQHDAGDRTDVSAEEGIDVETVIDLEPDLVLAADVTSEEDVDQLRDAGLTVYHFEDAQSLEDVRENVHLTGVLVDECDGADDRLEWMDERLEAIESALEDEERPLAFWSLGYGWTAGAFTFQDEILTTAGVENLAAEAGIEGWQEISDEQIVDGDPEWIVYGVESDGEDPGLSEGAMETTAYEEENLVSVDSNAVNQPAPHVVYAIEDIVEAVHPEAYEEAQATLEAAADETEGADDSEESTDDADAGDTDDEAEDDETAGEVTADDDVEDSIPGFGIPIAVAALFAVLGLRLRLRR